MTISPLQLYPSNPAYSTQQGRIVEESLANAIAYRCFNGKEARWVERLIQTQPAEYLGYAAASQVLVGAPEIIVRYPRDWFWLMQHIWIDWLGRIDFAEYQIASSLLIGHFNSVNITCWKQFKRTIAQSRGYQFKIWKDFAIYLLQAGLD